ncbi:hypothetical protein Ancab_021729 [Ancistrocladus abbreviatus]
MDKSLAPAEEPTKAGGKVLHHVPRCSSSSLFAADLEAVQSRFFANPPSPAFQSMLGLSALLDQEMLDPQQEVNVQEDVVAHQLDDMGVSLHSQSDLGLLPSAHAFSATERREKNGDQSLSKETLKKSKKGSRKLNKIEGKVLCFNEDDAVAVRLGESKSCDLCW